MIRALLTYIMAASLHVKAGNSGAYCQQALREAQPSELFMDLNGIASFTDGGLTIDRAKFAMMKHVNMRSEDGKIVITRNLGLGRESLVVQEVSDDPRIYDIEDDEQTGGLTDFWRSTRMRVQFMNGACIPLEVKQAHGAEPKSFTTLFALNDCLHDPAKSKNCRIQVAGLLDDPRASQAIQHSKIVLLKPEGPDAVH